MVFVSPVSEFYALKQLIGNVRVASGGEEGRKPVQAGENAVLNRVSRDMAGPAQNSRHAKAAFHDCPFALRERRGAAIGPGEEFGTVVGGEADNSDIVLSKRLHLLHHHADSVI